MPSPSRSPLRILVVDDHQGAATALARLLKALGHRVLVANTTLEGIELASRGELDLILHDLTMPVMDGYEAARGLRAMPALAGTLLIACSGSVDEAHAQRAGYDGWLEKPIRAETLDAVLEMAEQRVKQRAARSSSAR